MTIAAVPPNAGILCRPPVSADAVAIDSLVRACPPLEHNSVYAYLLIATHFAGTSAVATQSSRCVGFVSAYRRPDEPSTLFVWQVAVDARVRGRGVARRLLADILARPDLGDVRHLEATVAPDNQPSHRLFEAFAAERRADLRETPAFTPTDFGTAHHSAEHLLRVGPLS